MHRLTVLYPAKDGEAFDYDYYFGNHHKLLVSRLKPEGMVSCEFDKGVSDPAGDKAPYLAIADLNSIRPMNFKKRSPNMARRSWRHRQLHEDRTDHASERGDGELSRTAGGASALRPETVQRPQSLRAPTVDRRAAPLLPSFLSPPCDPARSQE